MQPLQEDGERPAPDPLAAPDDTNNNNNNKDYDDYSPAHTHLKTYTAGEDKSRLQQAARELGLRQARQPRRQVRKVHDFHQNPVSIQAFWNALWNSATEDARMRAVYVPPHYDAQGMLLGDYYHDNIDDDDYFFRHAPSQPDTELGPSRPPLSSSSAVDSHGEPLGGGNLTAAVLGIVKGMVGPAILYLPHGFATAGYLVALPIVMVCTLLFLYSSRCLLDAWKIEQEKVSPPQSRESDTSSSNERTALLPHHRPRQFLSYPELAYRALGPSGERTVQLGIALMQSGVCLTYLIFVPQNLHSSWLHLTNQSVAPSYWLIVMLGVQVPLSWIRDIRKFTPTNLLANGLILYGLVTCIGFALDEASQPWQPVAAVVDPAAVHDSPWANIGQHFAALQPWAADWFLFVGTSVLLFEGSITLLVPLQEAVDDEQQRAQFPAVYQRVILSIVGFYVVFGLTCWMAFGPDVQTVLTTSLPNTNLATTVQLAYSVAVLLTFPLQNFPALEIACRGIQSQVRKRTHLAVSRNVTSSVLVCLLGAVAVWTMDDLDKVVSLMGSLLGCPIAFCFPPLIHSRLDPNLSIQRLWANRIVAGLGVVAMVLASAVTLITW